MNASPKQLEFKLERHERSLASARLVMMEALRLLKPARGDQMPPHRRDKTSAVYRMLKNELGVA